MYCTNCGQHVLDDAIYCPHCGEKIGVRGVYRGNIYDDFGDAPGRSPRSRTTAKVLASIGGIVGAQSFYLGDTRKGMQQLALSLLGFPLISAIWGWSDAAKLSRGEIDTDSQGNYLQD